MTDREESLSFLHLQANLDENTILQVFDRGRSESGLTRWVDVYVIQEDNSGKLDLWRITYHVAQVIGRTYDRKREAIRVPGYGFSVAHDVAHSLSKAMLQNGKTFQYREH